MAKSRKKEEAASAEGEVATPQMSGDTVAANPDRERLASRAYELYLERGGSDGMDMEDWLEAERELIRLGQQPPDVKR
jgi:Protein of unknown function (DUF2934)